MPTPPASPSRRDLLLTGAAALTFGATRAAPASVPTRDRKLVVVYVHGGWDTSYSIDPKPGSSVVEGPEVDPPDPDNPDDREEIARFGEFDVAVNEAKRPNVSRFFESWADQTLLVGGLWIGGIAHYPNRMRLLTGGTDRSRPDISTIVGSRSDPLLPFGAIDLSSWGFSGPIGENLGRVGMRMQLGALLDPDEAFGGLPAPDRAVDALVDGYLGKRASAWLAEDSAAQWPADLNASLDRLSRLRDRRAEFAELLEGTAVPMGPGAREMEFAVGLLGGGWCRSVMLTAQSYFDTHAGNSDQHSLHDATYKDLDTLVSALSREGLLDETLVIVMSEMSRSPGRNNAGGKDHWPVCTHLMIGGGVAGGRKIGATDDLVQPMPMNIASGDLDPDGPLCRYDNFIAGALAHLDIDPAEWLPDVEPMGGFG